MNRKQIFLGFGFDAIKSGLMLLEASKLNNFERFVIVEVNERIVNEVRNEGNSIIINIAKSSGIDKFHTHNVEIYNPANTNNLIKIKESISIADEMAKGVLGGIYFLFNEKIDIELGTPKNTSSLYKKNIRKILIHLWQDEEDDGMQEKCLNFIISQLDEFKFIFLN